jgi:LysR family transcriptional regulator, transcriptional activator of nhaA
MNYHHLHHFFTIAKAGSIAKACEILHISQPAMSAQLKQFEQTLKRQLFERHKKRLRLTEDGRMVLDYAERIFDMGQQLEDTLRDRTPSGRLGIQIGVMAGTPRAFTDAVVSHVLKQNPAAHVFVEEKELSVLIQKLTDLSLDVLLTDTPVSDPEGIDCSSTLIGRVPVVFAASPALARRYEKALANKTEAPFVLATAPNTIYQQVKDFLSNGQIKARVVAEVQDISVAGRLASHGYGIAPLSSYLMAKRPYSNSLRALKWKMTEPIYESLYLVTRNRQWPNPMAVELLKTFKVSK